PWLTHMSTPHRSRGDTLDSAASSSTPSHDPTSVSSYLTPAQPPVYASFSPLTLATSTTSQPISAAKRLSTILVHQKSPLLLATPPQVTRALAYSHPFLLPLNKLAGLLTWTTGDPWESFLLVGLFWAVVLYGDVIIRFAGPVLLVFLLIGGMYGRRFSPLSSSGWSEDGGAGGAAPSKTKTKAKGKGKGSSGTDNSSSSGSGPAAATGAAAAASAAAGGGGTGGHSRGPSEVTNTKHQKTLDEIVETLKELTARCNILLEPLLELTDSLSTQRTATSATTRPALTRLLVRILMCTPFWVALTLPPFRIVTTRRVVLCFGTIVLTWHARVVKAGRTILWRSATVRRLAALLTGLDISIPEKPTPPGKKSKAQEALEKSMSASNKKSTGRASSSKESELTKAIRRARGANDAGVRFTFIIYENQRRWVGLGWTNSLFAYERAAWTDEHNNPVPSKDKFELPEVEDDSTMRWRWVDGGRWRVDGVPDEAVSDGDGERAPWDYDGEAGRNGWVYYDNKWQSGRRGQDGWGRWTRRRKWYRDAELVEVGSDDEEEEENTPTTRQGADEEAKELPASNTPTLGAERPPSLPPRPTLPTLAPPFTTTSDSMSSTDLLGDRKTDGLQEIKEEGGEADDVASVLSSSSRSMRFRMPSLRRRVTDSNPRQRRSRRTSEAQSEDEAASLERLGVGLGSPSSRGGDSWGVGDEVVMGLE
ncbi:Pex24p-domain-containing protein, partial [Cryphonectria parasitica EP155]